MSRGGVEVWVDATEEVIASEEIHSTTVMETTDTPIQKLLDTMVHEGEGFFDDGFYCNECRSMFQHQHLTDPNAINGPSFILDSPTIMGGPQRALLSLPHGLMIARSSIPNAGLGVVNQGPTVSPGMHFGPYEGEATSRLDAMASEYSWEICRGKDKWEYIDGASEMHSNWMRYVNCARNEQERNLLAVQYKDSVMFHCCRTIQQGDELLVWPSQTLLDNLSPAWNQIWFMKQTPTQTSTSSGMGHQNFACDQCQLPFTTETYLQRHTDYFHAPPPEEKKEVAATAADVSVVILNVDDHVVDDSAGGGKGKLCPDCGKTFKYDHHLARHQRCVHSNKRPYCCPLCRRSFSQASGLLRHQLVHKKLTSSVIRANRSSGAGGEQSHTVYQYTLTSTEEDGDPAAATMEHGDMPEVGGGGDDDDMDNDEDVVMDDSPNEEENNEEQQQQEEEEEEETTATKKTRTKKKDNLCTECGKSFTHMGYLRKHKLTVHNGVRPYVCTVCRKSFGQHHDLARHLKAHNVKRSHKRSGFWCAPCALTFCSEQSLKQHTNLVHPESSREAQQQQQQQQQPQQEEEEVGGGGGGEEGDTVVIDQGQEDPDGNVVNAVPVAVISLPDADGALPDDATPVTVPGGDDDDDEDDERVIDEDQGDDPDFVVDPSEAKEAEAEESLAKRRPQRLGARSKLAAITKRIAPKRKAGGRKGKKTKKGDEEEEEEEVEAEEPKGKKPRKWYICDQCKTTYGSQKELKTHKCTAPKATHACAQCGMEFKKSGFLKRHEKTAHKEEGPTSYSCDQCLKVFKKMSNLKSHQKSKRCERHTCTSELFPCDFCEFSFTLKSYLRKHLRRHHPVEFISSPHNQQDDPADQDDPDNPHLCPHCGKTYVSSRHFKAHSCFQEMRVVFLCTDCGKGFSNHYGLKQHQRIHTGEKPYKCPHCVKGFSYVGQLNVHIRTHTGEKPYLCTHCGESFRQSGDLKRHERKHTGVKPHNCPNCFKSFSRLQSLKAHEMLHLGQRKFKCTQCPRSFSRNYHLRRHHQKMHS